jgi:hypothetical protein
MSKHDDVRRKVTVLKSPENASFKGGSKTAQTNVKARGRNSIFNGTRNKNPLDYLLDSEKPKGKKQQTKVDPWMIRQAKLKAAKAKPTL